MITKLQYRILKHINANHIEFTFSELIDALNVKDNYSLYELKESFDDLIYSKGFFQPSNYVNENNERCFSISVKGKAAIEDYELNQESKLTIPKQANSLSEVANQNATKGNKIAAFSLGIAILSLLLSIVAIILNWLKN